MQTNKTTQAERTHETTCLAGIDSSAHECTCGNRSVTKHFDSSKLPGDHRDLSWIRAKAAKLGAILVIQADADGFVYAVRLNGKEYIDYTAEDCEETLDDLLDGGAMRDREATADYNEDR